MSLNSTLARSLNTFGRPCSARDEPAPSHPTSPGHPVSARRPIAHYFPQPRGDSFLHRHDPQLFGVSRQPLSPVADPTTTAPRSAHPGVVHLFALPPAPFGYHHLFHPPVSPATH